MASVQPSAPLVIRPPVAMRMYVAGFLVFWTVLVVWTTIVRHHGSSIAVGIFFVAVGFAMGFRLLRLGVVELPNGDLRVRNNFGGRVLHRADVEAFRIGTQRGGPVVSNAVQVLLTDNTIFGLDVTASPRFLGRARTKGQLADLASWLRNARSDQQAT